MPDSPEESSTLMPYYAALNRLVAGKSEVVPPGTKITLNAVAMEAGKSAGSIKKQRPVFAALIREVKQRAMEQEEQSLPGALKIREAKAKATKAKAEAESFEDKYKAALGRELMLLRAWEKLETRLRKIDNVVRIKPLSRP
ncbi:hypothetical protein [uncultured Pseudomonas sp.]|uniref:hypothetical protein n=1 Tax=uncultured Pseudomonas sp. TaxID=114707 RepID=UPI002583F23B|nr:hypothetical protein [uncultured Pseudomonas sp.]